MVDTVAGRDAPVLRHAVCGALQACWGGGGGGGGVVAAAREGRAWCTSWRACCRRCLTWVSWRRSPTC